MSLVQKSSAGLAGVLPGPVIQEERREGGRKDGQKEEGSHLLPQSLPPRDMDMKSVCKAVATAAPGSACESSSVCFSSFLSFNLGAQGSVCGFVNF